MKMTLRYLLPALLLVGLGACKKDKKQAPHDVFVGGTYMLVDGTTESACYWKNGEFFPVKDSTKQSQAYAMAVINGSVYLAGQFNEQPCYWKDGVRFDLPCNAQNEVALPGSRVFSIAQFKGWGLAESTPTFIGNGVFNALPNSRYIWQPAALAKPYFVLDDGTQPGNYCMKAKASDATHLYLVGDYTSGKTGYWLATFPPNTLTYELAWHALGNTDGGTFDVEFDQNNVYILGNRIVNNVTDYVYWKNDQLIPLNMSGPQVSINSFRVKNGSVYLLGDDNSGANSKACVWINSTKTTLDTNPSTATDLTFYGTDTFISGTVASKACYWKGTTLVNLNRNKSQGRVIIVQAKP